MPAPASRPADGGIAAGPGDPPQFAHKINGYPSLNSVQKIGIVSLWHWTNLDVTQVRQTFNSFQNLLCLTTVNQVYSALPT